MAGTGVLRSLPLGGANLETPMYQEAKAGTVQSPYSPLLSPLTLLLHSQVILSWDDF